MGKNVDLNDYIGKRPYENMNICGPIKAGKSAYLNAICKYNELDEHSDNKIGKHYVIFLDFSDYSGKTYEEAICYFRKKMSELYLKTFNYAQEYLHGCMLWEKFLDIVEGVADDNRLKGSLLDLVYMIRYDRDRDNYWRRPIIAIDEVSRPVLYAAKYGYLKEISAFYHDFLNIDHYELTAGIVTSSYAPANTDVYYNFISIKNVPANLIDPLVKIGELNGIAMEDIEFSKDYCLMTSYFNTAVGLEECFERMMRDSSFYENTSYDYEISLSEDIRSFINTKRIWIISEKRHQKEAEEKRRIRERLEYSEPLAWGIDMESQFAGVRNLDIRITDYQKYDGLNSILKNLYDEYGKDISSRQAYDSIQRVGGYCENIEEIREKVLTLKQVADLEKSCHRCWINVNDPFWAKVDLERVKEREVIGDLALIKAYISVEKENEAIIVFDKVLRFLIAKGKHLFHAKIAVRKRYDQICLWVSRNDFFLLEKFVEKLETKIITPLEFVPYRGKLGITREFYAWTSHNGYVADIISAYFKTIETRDEIDIVDMFTNYVLAWNGDWLEKDPLSLAFRGSNAQEFIIMLESLNVILGNEVIDDDNILLSGDGKLWRILGDSKNWHEVAVNWKSDQAC